jgi:hypothetical protein
VYDARAGVSQEKYVMRAVDPEAPTRQNRAHRQTYAFIGRHARPPGRLLAPRGVGVLEFPNIDALDARVRRLFDQLGIHRRAYAPTYVPGHVHEFCRASFEFAAARAGLGVARWETYALHPLKYLVYRHAPLGNKARVLVRRAA